MIREGVIIQTGVKLIGYLILFISLYLILSKVELYLKYKGVEDCASMAKIEKVENNIKAIFPIDDVYKACLKQKGIK